MTRRKLIAGNWKMNGWREDLSEVGMIAGAARSAQSDVVLCVPSTLISDAYNMAQNTPLKIGGQNCHARASGAFTGEVAAGMLWDAGASYVILGHSERREMFGETDALVRDKTEAALHAGLTAIVCIGETAEQRDAGRTMDVVLGQLDGSVPDWSRPQNVAVAYEPVWAIGSGATPTANQIGEVMAGLREALGRRFGEEGGAGYRLLYGGSVSPGNARAILGIDDVDGALVGGASLKAEDFGPIIEAAG